MTGPGKGEACFVPPSAVLELDGVVVAANGRVVLDIPRLTVERSETVAVLGSNGAGKSTLLRVACGLREIAAGRILLEGREASEPELRRATAAVLQRPLLRRGSVQRNVETGLRFRRVPRAEARRLAEPWLDRLAIGHLRERSARALSGGEAQRVSLARALATAPRLLILDEPFTGLDAPTRAELLGDLRAILAERETATLLATHDVREAAALARRIAVLHEGRLRQIGGTAEVLASPADEQCARILWSLQPGLEAVPRR